MTQGVPSLKKKKGGVPSEQLSLDSWFNAIPTEPVTAKTIETLQDVLQLSEEETVTFQHVLACADSCNAFFETFKNIPYSDKTFTEFYATLWAEIQKLDTGVKKLTQDEKLIKMLQFQFQGNIFKNLSESFIMCRALSKPFGYPGDFVMLQSLYDKVYPSPSHLGKYLDRFFIEDPLAQAVLKRVSIMSEKLFEFINETDKQDIHILNIASGSGFDLIPIAKTKHSKNITIHCMDQDISSLRFLKNTLALHNVNTTFKYYKADIKAFFKQWPVEQPFDLIYNIGLADYLPDKILMSLMQEAINHTTEGGRFVIAHKDHTLFETRNNEWLCGWKFYNRSLDQFKFDILPHLNQFKSHTFNFSDWTQIVFFSIFFK